MKLIRINNPFQRQNQDVSVVPYTNQSIETLMVEVLDKINAEYGTFFTLKQAEDIFRISINGLVIPTVFWSTTKPIENDQIVFMPIVAKGGSDKQILNIVVMVALVIAIGPGGMGADIAGMIGVSSTVGVAIVGAAVLVGAGILLQSLTPAPQVKGLNTGDFETSATYGWSPATTQKQGIVRPRFYGKNKLYGNVIAVHTEIDDTDDSKQNIKMLISLGAGPVQGIVSDTIKINDQNSDNFTDVNTEERLGTLNQSVVSFFGETKPEYRPNRIVTNDSGAITYTTPDKDFDGLEIELLFPHGVYYANNQGGLSTNSVGIKIEISEADADSWTTLVGERISNDTTSVKRKTYLASGTYTGGSPVTINNGTKYDIRVSKTTPDQTSSRYGDQLRLGSIREVINDDFIYPGTALLAIEALATDQLSGALNISCIQEGLIVNVYDGSNWSLEYSNNPAWVLFDIFTQPVISGDGSPGSPYTVERYEGANPSRLNTSKFYELAVSCDTDTIPDGKGGTEKRIRFNGGFDIGTSPWEAALKVCEIARCIPIWTGSELTLAIDKAEDYVQLFNVADIKEGSFKESFMAQSELVSEIEIQYHDEDQDFKRVPFTLIENTLSNYSSRATLELFGITKQSEAWRAGMHRLKQNRYLKSIIEFEADIDAVNSTLGNVIAVQHDIPDWGQGGRVISATTLSIIVDKDMIYVSGSQHEIFVRKADGTLNLLTTTSKYNDIIGVDQDNKQFTISDNFVNEYLSGDSIKVIDSIGNDGTFTLSTGAVYNAGVTTITVNEAIPDSMEDSASWYGGLYNQRRIVVSSVFKNASDAAEAPAKDDLYTFGIQDLHARQYRILKMSKTSDQYIKLIAIEYNALVYDADGEDPIIATEEGITSPDSDNSGGNTIVLNPSWGDVERRYPPIASIGPPVLDVPQITDILFSDDVLNLQITWASGVISYKGAVFAISSGSSSTKKYVYWDSNSNPTTLQSTSTQTDAVGADKFILAVNNSGIAFPIGVGQPYWGELLVVETLSALTAQLGDVLAGSITGSIITGGIIRTSVGGRRVQIDSGGVKLLYGESGGKIGTTANGGDNIVVGASIQKDITDVSNADQAVIDCDASVFEIGNLVRVTGVVGIEEINYANAGLLEIVDIPSSLDSITVDFDTDESGIGAYVSGGVIEAGFGALVGAGFLATINNTTAGKEVPFRVESEQSVGDFHYFNRQNDPSGTSEIGDTCVVSGVHKTCTVAGTPGTWTITGSQS